MKTRVVSFYAKVVSFLLMLLGFQSCNTAMVEYGTPSATFKVKGKVQDSDTKEPIKNVRAVLVRVQHHENSNQKIENIYETDTVYTNNAGEFSTSVTSFPKSNVEFKIKFDDVDGIENGEYESKDVEVIFENPKYEGKSGNWHEGEVTKNIGAIDLKSAK